MPVCTCTLHESDSSSSVINITTSKKFKKCVVQYAIANDKFSTRSKYMCVECYEKLKSENNNTNKHNEKIDEVVALIVNNEISEKQQIDLAIALGTSISKKIFDDGKVISGQFKNNDFMKSYNTREWLKNRNPVVLNFIQSATDTPDIDTCCSRKLQRINTCLEIVYGTRNTNLITPMCFGFNILNYYQSGSKSICNFSSSILPAGSYSTILNWTNSHSMDKIVLQNNGNDIVTFFDNNQKLGRSWRVRVDCKMNVSVMTNIMHIQPHNITTFQKNPNLSPEKWLYVPKVNLNDEIQNIFEDCGIKFRQYRNGFIKERLQLVMKENVEIDDNISKCIKNNKKIKIDSCSRRNLDTYNFCEGNIKGKCTYTLGEPLMENPCSYKAIEKVFDHIIQNTVRDGRAWTIIGCDGLPYSLVLNIIENNEAYRNILMVPGHGHFEMNMARALIQLLWEPILKELAIMLGFKTPKALMVCLQGSDHHKAWQMLEIFLFGTTDELLVPFVKSCKEIDKTPTVEGYYEWMSKIADPNYKFLSESVMTYTLALYLYRVGCRRNNSQMITTSRMKFSPLFYGMNKTTYQKIDTNDMKMRIMAPAEVKTFLQDNETFSISGHESKGEGGDFILEGLNRKCKRWIVPGCPTEKQWYRTCRNLDTLEKIRDNINNNIKNEEKGEHIRHTNIDNEIFSWRCVIRKSFYLLYPEDGNLNLTSIEGKILNPDLINFTIFCKENRQKFLQDPGSKLKQLCVTTEQLENSFDLSKKTKQEIKAVLCDKLSSIRDLDRRIATELETKHKKCLLSINTKAVMLTTLNIMEEVLEYLEEREDEEDECDGENPCFL